MQHTLCLLHAELERQKTDLAAMIIAKHLNHTEGTAGACVEPPLCASCGKKIIISRMGITSPML